MTKEQLILKKHLLAYGIVLRQARLRKQITQQALAKSMGISQATLSRMEAGNSFIQGVMWCRVAKAVGDSLDRMDAHAGKAIDLANSIIKRVGATAISEGAVAGLLRFTVEATGPKSRKGR